MAEPIAEMGLKYVGIDVDLDCLKDLDDRGFETIVADLNEPDVVLDSLNERLEGRDISALISVDLLEHIVAGRALLGALHDLSLAHGSVPLILAVPNVTHFDVAAKLLLGRFDYTPTGLLDDTHVQFFSPERLRSLATDARWMQFDANDFELQKSDQHFPDNLTVLSPATPLNQLLFRLRDQATEGALVNEFVRAFLPLEAIVHDNFSSSPPFLTVLVRTQGRRHATLEETLLSLAAQTCQDFEVLLLAHNVADEGIAVLDALCGGFDQDFRSRLRILSVQGGGRARPLNVGVSNANGSYVAALDDDDLAFANWVEVFRDSAKGSPGKVLRSMVAAQQITQVPWIDRSGYTVTGAPNCTWPEQFQLLSHLSENSSPFCGFAVPRSCFSEMGLKFDESLPVVEDWDLLLQAALWCGVTDTLEVTSLYRRWEKGHSSYHAHGEDEWRRTRDVVLARLDRSPLLLPPGTLSDLHRLVEETSTLRDSVTTIGHERDAYASALADVQAEIAALQRSTSWWITRPFRRLGVAARRVVGRHHHRV